MKVYIVQRYGIYDQGLCGIYEDEESARDRASQAKKAEEDDYHGFVVVECELNQAMAPEEYRSRGDCVIPGKAGRSWS